MNAETPKIDPGHSSKAGRKRVRRRRSGAGHDFLSLSRERLNWRELLRTDRKFAVFVSFLLVIAGVSLVLLPRVWRASPSGFLPVFRVSGLDLLRQRLAIRAAESAESRGDFPRALEAWRRAMIANIASTQSKRRFLELCVLRGQPESEPDSLRLQLRQANLLLRLTGTNQADLELTAAVAHAAELEERTVKILSPRPMESLSPSGLTTLAGAYFQQDDFGAFRRIAEAYPGLTNPLFVLQRSAADLIAFGPNSAADWGRLEASSADPRLRLAGARLRLVAAAYRGEEGQFSQAWAELDQATALRPRDRVRRWQLFTRQGRPTEALNSALTFDVRPLTASEAVQVVRELDRIGLASKAIAYGEAALARHRSEPALWREVGRLMVRTAQPEYLISFASKLLRVELEDEPQPGFASYCLGVAEHLLGHRLRADEAFGEAAGDPMLARLPLLALECADTMRRMGYLERAERITQAIASEHGVIPGFWIRVQRAAREARAETWLLDAARREYAATPTSPEVQKRYLDALVLNRTNAVEALTLANTLHQAAPDDPVQVVALGEALALQRKWSEVERVLVFLDDEALRRAGPEATARYQLTRGEALVELERRRVAAALIANIDATQLFPGGIERLQLLRERAR